MRKHGHGIGLLVTAAAAVVMIPTVAFTFGSVSHGSVSPVMASTGTHPSARGILARSYWVVVLANTYHVVDHAKTVFIPGYPAHKHTFQLQHDVYRSTVSLKPLMKHIVDTGYVVYHSPSKTWKTRRPEVVGVIVRKHAAQREHGQKWRA